MLSMNNTLEQATIFDAIERSAIVERLDRAIENWQRVGTDKSLPDEFARLLRKRDLIAAGEPYIRRDITEEVMRQCGKWLHKCAMDKDNEIRQYLSRKKGGA